MQRKIVIFAVMVVLIAGLLMFARYRRMNGPAGGTVATVAAKGGQAPDFTLTDLQGHTLRLSDLRGKAVVLNFWATWCPPCKQEIPWFVEMQKQYGSQGLQIVGVSMDDSGDQKDVEKFVRENTVNYPILMGQEAVAREYGGIDYLPTTFYIGRDGRVLERIFGQPEREEIEKNVQRALASQPAS